MSEFHKDRELEHMFELQGNNRSGCPDHTADIWDKRMKNWKQNFWTANLKDNGSGKSMARSSVSRSEDQTSELKPRVPIP